MKAELQVLYRHPPGYLSAGAELCLTVTLFSPQRRWCWPWWAPGPTPGPGRRRSSCPCQRGQGVRLNQAGNLTQCLPQSLKLCVCVRVCVTLPRLSSFEAFLEERAECFCRTESVSAGAHTASPAACIPSALLTCCPEPCLLRILVSWPSS